MFSGVNPFAFYTGLGAVIGVWQVARRAPQQDLPRWIGAAWVVLLGCLLGARAGFVFSHLTYYRNHTAEAFQPWMGGLDWPGALLGGLAAFAIVWRLWRAPLERLADGLAPLALPLAVGVWLGCWEAGCAYGTPLQGGWGIPVVDETGLVLKRFPVQALAVLALILIAVWLELRSFLPAPPGRYASRVGLGLGAVMLAAEFLRADPAPRWAGLRPGAWVALALVLVSLAIIWRLRLYGAPPPDPGATSR